LKFVEVIYSIPVLTNFGKILKILIPCNRTSLHVKEESKILGSKQGTLYNRILQNTKRDAVTYAQFVERSRIFKFLLGLNPKYDLVRTYILRKERLPFLFAVFYIISGEETRRMIMVNEPSTKGFAMFSRKVSYTGTSNLGSMKLNSRGKEDHWCSHYKRSCHTKETCIKLYGKEKTLTLVKLKG